MASSCDQATSLSRLKLLISSSEFFRSCWHSGIAALIGHCKCSLLSSNSRLAPWGIPDKSGLLIIRSLALIWATFGFFVFFCLTLDEVAFAWLVRAGEVGRFWSRGQLFLGSCRHRSCMPSSAQEILRWVLVGKWLEALANAYFFGFLFVFILKIDRLTVDCLRCLSLSLAPCRVNFIRRYLLRYLQQQTVLIGDPKNFSELPSGFTGFAELLCIIFLICRFPWWVVSLLRDTCDRMR